MAVPTPRAGPPAPGWHRRRSAASPARRPPLARPSHTRASESHLVERPADVHRPRLSARAALHGIASDSAQSSLKTVRIDSARRLTIPCRQRAPASPSSCRGVTSHRMVRAPRSSSRDATVRFVMISPPSDASSAVNLRQLAGAALREGPPHGVRHRAEAMPPRRRRVQTQRRVRRESREERLRADARNRPDATAVAERSASIRSAPSAKDDGAHVAVPAHRRPGRSTSGQGEQRAVHTRLGPCRDPRPCHQASGRSRRRRSDRAGARRQAADRSSLRQPRASSEKTVRRRRVGKPTSRCRGETQGV